MFGLKVGLKGLVLRLGFEVGSRDRVQINDLQALEHILYDMGFVCLER